ncbi:FHA domain-containing protein [Pedobacter metabolipauper]|uniref:FHA domain-containing protein n=1 Tax=Pedobacter metabolipauper TaxID=425513 RepID=A0A4V3D165_9SPHI|nr:FHA domain-containing protein [Pedobacter metabolipauper]TDQ09437.1 FHA domain-containing protein [Pedobacter metabolipauper]
MTRVELLDFLELPDSSSEDEIRIRLDDKLTYFQHLTENAPNDFLKKLHSANTEKIKNIQKELSAAGAKGPTPTTNHLMVNVDTPYSAHADTVTTGANILSAQRNKDAVAWLVRHTENQSAKTFPLYYGKNYIGRNAHPAVHTIVINEDPYVSRIHTLLDVTNTNPLEIIVSDDSHGNAGRASKNGTYINGNENRLTKKMIIGENDTIQVGMTKFNIKPSTNNINDILQEVEESEYMKTVVINLF